MELYLKNNNQKPHFCKDVMTNIMYTYLDCGYTISRTCNIRPTKSVNL